MQNADNLRVTGEARELAIEVYRTTGGFPSTERFGLTSQMRRAAVSIGSNLAEGCGRMSNRELVQFLHVALGSTSELAFQTRVAAALVLLGEHDASRLLAQIEAVKRMLSSLIKARRTRAKRPSADP